MAVKIIGRGRRAILHVGKLLPHVLHDQTDDDGGQNQNGEITAKKAVSPHRHTSPLASGRILFDNNILSRSSPWGLIPKIGLRRPARDDLARHQIILL